MSSPSSSFSAERPTLPPLHTLDLPVPFARRGSSPESYDMHDSSPSTNNMYHSRRASTFSSTSSRTPSPPPSQSERCSSRIKLPTLPSLPSLQSAPSPSTPSRRVRPIVNPGKFKLVPCSLEEAQAVVLVPPPGVPQVPSLASSISKRPGQALLLVGQALDYVRHPQRQIAKGARIHPYRVLRNGEKGLATKPAPLP